MKQIIKYQHIIASLLIAIAIVTASALYFFKPTDEVLGSTSRGSEYFATSTVKAKIGGNNMANYQVLSSDSGTLGSIVITGANTGNFILYDATSTVNNALWATTTLVQIPASMAAGTYTFDVVFQKGLLIEIVGTLPTSTITWRP